MILASLALVVFKSIVLCKIISYLVEVGENMIVLILPLKGFVQILRFQRVEMLI